MSTAAKVRLLTGRCNVSKISNKSDKTASELDTPTDLPQAAVDKISKSLNTRFI
jgi:starvation-inducible DNA-binding protein